MKIKIPRLPPSINTAYNIINNVQVASGKLLKFRDFVNSFLQKLTIVKILGPVKMTVIFSLYHDQNYDLDNLLKVLIDCLKDICFEDDRCIIELSCLKKLNQDQEATEIIIEPYSGKAGSPTLSH